TKATDQIGAKIGEIQSATNRTVGSINKIVGTIDQMREIASTITSSVKQQGVATQEIASSASLAARGTGDVNAAIGSVGSSVESVGSSSSNLMQLSGSLSKQAADLQAEVVAFVSRLSA